MKRNSNSHTILKRWWECLRGPLPEMYNAIYYSVQGYLKLNPYGYAETLSSDFGTKTWAMACDLENLLTPGRNGKQLITGLIIHRLIGRKDVVQMLHKLNICSSYNDIRLQNKSWARMVASRKCIGKHMLKKLPVQATIDNNGGMQDMKSATYKRYDRWYEYDAFPATV